MKKLIPKTLISWLVVLSISVFVFVGFDMGCGTHSQARGIVLGKRTIPAWVETQFSSDSDGHTTSSTIYHQQEWIAEVDYNGSVQDVNVKHWDYESLETGQPVTVSFREGKWTGINYLKQIQ